MNRTLSVAILIAVLPLSAAVAQRPIALAPNAPQDRPVDARSQCQLLAMAAAIEPYIAKARATFPAAKETFTHGLSPRETFFVTIQLTDSLAHNEQVFLAVDSLANGRIIGRLASPIDLVVGYHISQRLEVGDADIVDWMISQPDGSEVGNVVGKFLDTYRPTRDCPDSSTRR